MKIDVSTLNLDEIVEFQNALSEEVRRRFTRDLALCFTDIVGSTTFVSRFGDEAGRRLHHRHIDNIRKAIAPTHGRIVDTAGDGAFARFLTVAEAAAAMCEFYRIVCEDNYRRPPEDELSVRCGLHWGQTITDGVTASGKAVNLCARVMQAAHGGEILITGDAERELPSKLKTRAVALPAEVLKDIQRPIDLFRLDWQEREKLVTSIRVDETGEEILLPAKDTISFGRSSGDARTSGNDVILTVNDPEADKAISRQHFELRRGPSGFKLRALSPGVTVVNQKRLAQGDTEDLPPGSVVRVANTVTLRFLGPEAPADDSLATRLS